MRDLITSMEFWVAMVFAVVLKLKSSPLITVVGAITTTIAAVTSALIFTEPVLVWLNLDGSTFTFAVCAIVALTGEHIARQVLGLQLFDLLKLWWRGKK